MPKPRKPKPRKPKTPKVKPRQNETLLEKVRKHMRTILARHPEGMRSKTLTDEIHQKIPGVRRDSIRALLSPITDAPSSQFYKISEPGAAYYFSYQVTQTETSKGLSEDVLYKPFAEYLLYGDEKLGVCTHAFPLGGNVFGNKWSTPDAIGLFEPHHNDVIGFPTEVVSAEIKSTPNEVMEGFGQACAYRLFSHRIYLVIPEIKELPRIEELCRVIGIGLVCIDMDAAQEAFAQDQKNVEEKGEWDSVFSVLLLAQKHEPNMFYANMYMKKIGHLL